MNYWGFMVMCEKAIHVFIRLVCIQCFLLFEGGLENPENGSEGESLSSP